MSKLPCRNETKNVNKNSLKKILIHAAQLWIEKDIAPEYIEEKNGYFYILKFTINNEERNIYYSQNHMSKIAQFIKVSIENTNINVVELVKSN